MSKILIIGAGAVGSVVAQKCAQVPEVFSSICIASRRIESSEKIRSQIGFGHPFYRNCAA